MEVIYCSKLFYMCKRINWRVKSYDKFLYILSLWKRCVRVTLVPCKVQHELGVILKAANQLLKLISRVCQLYLSKYCSYFPANRIKRTRRRFESRCLCICVNICKLLICGVRDVFCVFGANCAFLPL